jgi:hypothetical protein
MRPPLHSPVERATLQPLFQAFPFPSTLGEVALHPPSPADLFTYSSMRECPHPLAGAQGALPSLLRVFFFQLLVYYSVCFFPFFP